MNAVVTGGQDYVLTRADYRILEHAVAMLRVKEIYTNGLPGVPAQIEAWARRRGIAVRRVTANFMHEGPASPEERNTTLVNLAKAVIAFPGGSESDDLVAKARKAKRSVFESPGRQLAKLPTMDMRLRHLWPRTGGRISP
jgi:hypothetical protein